MNQSRAPEQVILSLGANLGDRREQLSAAIILLKQYSSLTVIVESSIYETPPIGVGPEHGPYLNQALAVETALSAPEMLKVCREIEMAIGRPGERKTMEPRLIDIDIISYGAQVSHDQDLTLPHPRYKERLFVLAPLAEICPTFRDPLTGLRIDDLIEACGDESVIERLEKMEVGA